MNNPYLDKLLKNVPFHDGAYFRDGFSTYRLDGDKFIDYRRSYVMEYAWAIPDDAALTAISHFTKSICEIGAGTGYWAYMLNQYGVSINAYDIAVPGTHKNAYKHTKLWYPVKHGDVLTISQHQHQTLMLCWPPYDDTMAESILNLYTGSKVIYIGEDEGGCTATTNFIYHLFRSFNVERLNLLNWDGIHDSLYLCTRKTSS